MIEIHFGRASYNEGGGNNRPFGSFLCGTYKVSSVLADGKRFEIY